MRRTRNSFYGPTQQNAANDVDDNYIYNFVRKSLNVQPTQQIRTRSITEQRQLSFTRKHEKSSCELFQEVFNKRALSLRVQQNIKESFERKLLKQLLMQPQKIQLKKVVSQRPQKKLRVRHNQSTQPQLTQASQSMVTQPMTEQTKTMVVQETPIQTQPLTNNIIDEGICISENIYKNGSRFSRRSSVQMRQSQTGCESLDDLFLEKSGFDLLTDSASALQDCNKDQRKIHPLARKYVPQTLPLQAFQKENTQSKPPKPSVKKAGMSVELRKVEKTINTLNYIKELEGRISCIEMQNDFTPWPTDDINYLR